jgi:hypothetical protein
MAQRPLHIDGERQPILRRTGPRMDDNFGSLPTEISSRGGPFGLVLLGTLNRRQTLMLRRRNPTGRHTPRSCTSREGAPGFVPTPKPLFITRRSAATSSGRRTRWRILKLRHESVSQVRLPRAGSGPAHREPPGDVDRLTERQCRSINEKNASLLDAVGPHNRLPHAAALQADAIAAVDLAKRVSGYPESRSGPTQCTPPCIGANG